MIRPIDYAQTEITGGFWKEKQELVRNTTVHAVYERFRETGRFDAFCCNWKEGQPNKPHVFWDSDVAKWIEGVAYLTRKKREPELERIVDEVVDLMEQNRMDDGYYNSYYITVEPQKRFTDRNAHELYCAGHLMEAAVAYYEATGKRKLLDLMCQYADLIEQRFKIRQDAAFRTPGHEEIELALVRLYECTKEERYLALAEHFVRARGSQEENAALSVWSPIYSQSHLPVQEQTRADGHAVRAVYLYCGMADVARLTQDDVMKAACETIFENIVRKRMYITGGIGSSSAGEAFTVDYDLPNLLAYTETCAALGLALFANRMLLFGADSRYSDTVERILYNGFLSGLSLDGKSFFYQNPLEILPYLHTRDANVERASLRLPPMRRSEVFSCSCCPPNIVRFIPEIANFLYTDDGETLYVHQFMQSTATVNRGDCRLTVEQETAYPENGVVKITVRGGNTRIAVRIPGWYHGYAGDTKNGYAYFDVTDGETLCFDFAMKPVFIEARPEAVFDCNRYAVMRGPMVYCMESVDNGAYLRDVRLDSRAEFETGTHPTMGVPTLSVRAFRRDIPDSAPLYREKSDCLIETRATLIPYYAFANRKEAEMQVWHAIV